MTLTGIGVSSGIVMGKVLKITLQKPQINDQKIVNFMQEIAHFKDCIKKTVEQIMQIKKLAENNLSKEDVSIFDAHIQVATDPTFQDDVIQMIQTQKNNSIFATHTIAQKYILMFEQMDNQYMRERAADIKDVTRRLINNLAGIEVINLTNLNEKVILVSHDITPSETVQMNKEFVLGFVTEVGGRTSHAAIMAQSLEIPAVLGVDNIVNKVNNHDQIIIDCDNGVVILKPTDAEIKFFVQKIKDQKVAKLNQETYRNKLTISNDGVKFELAANIGSLTDLESVIKNDAEAIGLFRSEFLYMDKNDWPSEDEQYHAYKQVLEKMGDKLVVVRTLDIGGDKELKYFKFPQEDNPFLGYRAIRFSLDEKEKFITQLRALIRASAYGNLAIMFPMIATIEEFLAAKAIYNNVYQQLKEDHVDIRANIQVGMMIEIPSAAILAKQFAKHADFFSIGTNDLMQYTMAHDRMNAKVAYLYQPLSPAILNLIVQIVKGGHSQGKWVGMCGEMAGDKSVIPFLIGLGLDELSMTPTSILKARAQIAKINVKDAQKLVKKALAMGSTAEVKKLLENFKISK